jgi:hypothetical protein
LSSCLENDPVITQVQPTEFYVALDPKSVNSVYISSFEKKIIKECVSDSIWHLKFQNGKGDWAIFLNPQQDITVHNTNITNYGEIDYTYVLDNIEWHRDVPLKNSMLPAIGTWGDYKFSNPKSFRNVYILRARIGLNLSYYKFQMLDVTGGNYQIRFGKLDGSVDHTYLVKKDARYNHSYLLIAANPRSLHLEPPTDQWECCFTFGLDSLQNSESLLPLKEIDDFTGIFPLIAMNKGNVSVAIESSLTFAEVDYFYAKNMDFVSYEQLPNLIAHYNYDRKIYETASNITLVMKRDKYYYKMKASNVSSISPDAFKILLAIQSL